MEITKVSPQARNPERVNLYVDGRFYRGLDRLVAMKLGLRPGLTMNPQLVGKLETTQSENSAWEWALRSLQISPKSVREMRQKLQRKFETDVAEALIRRLQEAGLLNDMRLGEQLAGQWMQRATKSRREIVMKLRQKGIDAAIVDNIMATLDGDTEAALNLARIKNRTLRVELPWSERYQKLASYLARKGFSYIEIKRAVTPDNLTGNT